MYGSATLAMVWSSDCSKRRADGEDRDHRPVGDVVLLSHLVGHT